LDLYIIDTVAFLAYLADKLPGEADKLFKKAEKKQIKLLLPSIVLGESLYTIYKGRDIFGKSISLEKVDLIFQILKNKDVIELVNLSLEGWQIFHGLKLPELHDRIILAIYHLYKAKAIVTNDPEISEITSSIW